MFGTESIRLHMHYCHCKHVDHNKQVLDKKEKKKKRPDGLPIISQIPYIQIFSELKNHLHSLIPISSIDFQFSWWKVSVTLFLPYWSKWRFKVIFQAWFTFSLQYSSKEVNKCNVMVFKNKNNINWFLNHTDEDGNPIVKLLHCKWKMVWFHF